MYYWRVCNLNIRVIFRLRGVCFMHIYYIVYRRGVAIVILYLHHIKLGSGVVLAWWRHVMCVCLCVCMCVCVLKFGFVFHAYFMCPEFDLEKTARVYVEPRGILLWASDDDEDTTACVCLNDFCGRLFQLCRRHRNIRHIIERTRV